MTDTSTGDRVRALLAEHLCIEPSAITEGATFEDLGADSLDIIEIEMAIEEAFPGITYEEGRYNTESTVSDLVSYVGELVAA
jgi:acyl carrier protein